MSREGRRGAQALVWVHFVQGGRGERGEKGKGWLNLLLAKDPTQNKASSNYTAVEMSLGLVLGSASLPASP